MIDFGAAKAAGQPLTEKTLATGLGAVVGTPEYMSPEQASFNNLDIDTRSDVTPRSMAEGRMTELPGWSGLPARYFGLWILPNPYGIGDSSEVNPGGYFGGIA